MNIKKLRSRIRDFINKSNDEKLLIRIAKILKLKFRDLLEGNN